MEQGLPWHKGLVENWRKMFEITKDYDQIPAHKHYKKDKPISVITSYKPFRKDAEKG